MLPVDIVTERRANLHNELIRLLGTGEPFLVPGDDLLAVAYRPVRQSPTRTGPATEQIHVWPAGLAPGHALPVLPLALDRGICLPLDLEATYTEACQRSRIGPAGR